MTCFIDSNVFIAYADKRDENHERSVELMHKAIGKKEFGRLFLSDYVVDECLTFTYNRTKDKKRTIGLGQHMLSPTFDKIYASPEIFEKAWSLFKKTEQLSFTDCTIAAQMQTLGIGFLMSFDSHFDQLGIKRVF